MQHTIHKFEVAQLLSKLSTDLAERAKSHELEGNGKKSKGLFASISKNIEAGVSYGKASGLLEASQVLLQEASTILDEPEKSTVTKAKKNA